MARRTKSLPTPVINHVYVVVENFLLLQSYCASTKKSTAASGKVTINQMQILLSKFMEEIDKSFEQTSEILVESSLT